MELISGLNDDIGLQCLTRVPFDSFPSVSSVCKAWNIQIRSTHFHRIRKLSGLTRPVFILSQARSGPVHIPGSRNTEKCHANPVYWLTVFDPESGSWTRLPTEPGLSGGLPMFCGVVGVGSVLIVMGGWDPLTWRVSRAVYIFDFLTGQWRRGADIPGQARSLFGLAGDPVSGTVLVAGGHDEEKTALRSAVLYDVAKDTWVHLPDMAKERDECSILFHGGMFHVISGYDTENQGCFGNNTETLNPDTWQWGPTNESLTNPRCWIVNDAEGDLYTCQNGYVSVKRGNKWQGIVEMPCQPENSKKVMMWQNKMVVIGCSRYDESNNAYYAYVLDLKSRVWSKVEMPGEYSGHVQSGCAMEL